jgi:hypothetical protein
MNENVTNTLFGKCLGLVGYSNLVRASMEVLFCNSAEVGIFSELVCAFA